MSSKNSIQYHRLDEEDSVPPTSQGSKPVGRKAILYSLTVNCVLTILLILSISNSLFLSSKEGLSGFNESFFSGVNPFGISKATLDALNAPANSYRFKKMENDDYMANLAVFHQLHCLKTIWQYTYLDYYQTSNKLFSEPDKEIHHHLDHCVDMLRQALMCSADTTVLTFKWDEKKGLPTPHYDAPRMCRNFEAILQWGMDRAIPWPEDK